MQKAIIRRGSAPDLQSVLKQFNERKIFLVTGKSSYVKSGAKAIIDGIQGDFEIVHFSDFQTNPDWEDVKKGVFFFNQSNAQIIVAVGGGSVIDMGKLINYYYNVDLNYTNDNNIINPQFTPVPLVCMPTTAGSGSEATHFAVMYIGNNKYSIAHADLLPSQVLIDPNLQRSQSPYQKIVSGIDAFSQAIESMWSIYSTLESIDLAEKAVELLWNNLQNSIDSNQHEAQLKVALGAYRAGQAINITKTTGPHALAYGFTKIVGLPHGHAVALSLPFFIQYHRNVTAQNCIDKRGASHVKNKMNRIAEIINADPNYLEKVIVDFFDKLKLEIRFSQLNISKETFINATRNINYERMANNPVKVDEQTVQNIYTFNQQL